MKKTILALAILGLVGCSASNPVMQMVRNVTAANCATPADQAAFVANLPPNPFINGAQQAALQSQICHAMYGDVAAPVTAPGNTPAIPAAPVSPAPAAK